MHIHKPFLVDSFANQKDEYPLVLSVVNMCSLACTGANSLQSDYRI
jgi:hypothetical protein